MNAGYLSHVDFVWLALLGAALGSMLGRWPVQNIVAMAGLVGVLAEGLESALTGKLAPWTRAALWLVTLVAARGTVQWFLQSHRLRDYGWWLIAVSGVLSAALVTAVLPGATTTAFAWRLAGAWAMLLAMVPWLIRKKPVVLPADWRPVLLWMGLNVLLWAARIQ